MGWLIYLRSKTDLEDFLQTVNFDRDTARMISSFSIREVGWFILLLSSLLLFYPWF